MTTYAYTSWFFPIFLVACISSVLLVSIRSVLKPLSQYESHISSDINGNSDSKWKLAPRSRGNSNCSRNLSRSDQRAIPYSHRQSYDPRRYPLLYKNILQQEESAKFGIHSGDGYQHTSQLREHLQRLQIEKLKKSELSQTSDSDENSDPIVLTDVRFAQPQGLHVNLDIKIRIAQTCDGGYQRSCFRRNGICDGGDIHPIEEEKEEKEERTSFDKSEREEEKDKKCLRTRNVAVVFFLPSGCYIDQQEIEARRSFPVEAEKVLLHTYAASSNPELLAEEAEGEVIVFEFIDLLDYRECQCHSSKNKEKENEKEKGKEKEKEKGIDNDYEQKEKEEKEKEEKEREKEEGDRERKHEGRMKNTLSTIAILDFQLPIHLRYHTPYDEYLPVENTVTGKYPDYKKVIIPYPTVFRSAENCIQHTVSDRPLPRIKRIYDVSFLGQKGNVQSSMMDENFYVKLNGLKNNKNGDKQIQEMEKEKDYEVDKREGGIGGGGGRERERERGRARGEEEKQHEEEETIELKVPIGCYSNDFVLIVTVACYFFSSSAIVYSLIF